MKQFLYSHNLKAYEAVKAHHAEGNRKACVVHATGTGKSYIIAALAEDYECVLLVAPNDYVLDQVRRNAGNKLRYMTYAKLMTDARKGIIYSNCYDLIVFDEYHRAGAEQWEDGVQSLLQSNAEAYIFGTTATDIRYLDERRNMSDELFDGHVVSTLTIGEAWARNILPSPVYVCSLESFEETERTYRQRIEESNVSEEEKKSFTGRLAAVGKDWENVGGVPSIIRKHLSGGIKRILLFCPDIDSTFRYRKLVRQWFSKAGLDIERINTIESRQSPSVNKKEMDCFQEEGEGGIKVMISINMLNEGIHVPHVDAIIMLRGTSSGNIYLQQLGRCMQAGAVTRRPVVLDLANNITSAFTDSSFHAERGNYDRAVKDLSEENKDVEPGAFVEVVDYLMDVREVLSMLDERMAYCDRWDVWERRYQIAKDYHDKNGKFPSGKEWEWLRTYFGNNARKCPSEERTALLMAIGWRPEESIWEVNYKKAKTFYEQHGRFPGKEDDRDLWKYIKKWEGSTGKNHPELKQKLRDIGWSEKPSKEEIWEQKYREAKKIYEETGRFPKASHPSKLWDWADRWESKYGENDPVRMKQLKEIGFTRKRVYWKTMYLQAKEIFERTGHFPTRKENKKLRHWFILWRSVYGHKYPDKMRMLQEIGFDEVNLKNRRKQM